MTPSSWFPMLHAIVHGKAGRIRDGERSIAWHEVFRTHEDPLTAALFGRFRYLNPVRQSDFLRSVTGREWRWGSLVDLHFWPRFELDGGSVEPDVLLEFDYGVLIVEVKPPHRGRQTLHQWRRQVRGYLLDQDHADPCLLLLAIGRNETEGDTELTVSLGKGLTRTVLVVQRNWTSVHDALYALSPPDLHEACVVNDMLSALSLYGVSPGVPEWGRLSEVAGKGLGRAPELATAWPAPWK
jgi:hypothetical protein